MAVIAAMVGNIEAGAFENHRYRRENTLDIAAALGAGDFIIITETSK